MGMFVFTWILSLCWSVLYLLINQDHMTDQEMAMNTITPAFLLVLSVGLAIYVSVHRYHKRKG